MWGIDLPTVWTTLLVYRFSFSEINVRALHYYSLLANERNLISLVSWCCQRNVAETVSGHLYQVW